MLTVRVSDEEVAQLAAIAKAKGYSMSELVRALIRRGLPYARDIAPKDTSTAVRSSVVAAVA